MNEDLSDDLSSWPDDPYQLLGVSYSDTERTVRLAYTRLIRRFKPEQFPEHFRRLREAYESVRAQLQWRERLSQEEDAAEPTLPSLQTPVSPAGESQFSAEFQLQADLNQAWQVAQDGDYHQAYSMLQSLRGQHGPHRDISLREYWLLKVVPQLDNQRSRFVPLTETLSLDRCSGPAFELYARELLRFPGEALAPRFATLLQSSCDLQSLANLLHIRWTAAGRLQNHAAILQDLDTFRPTIAARDDIVWFGLLLVALDQLAWSEDRAIARSFASLLAETRELDSVHHTLAEDVDRLEFLAALHAGYARLRAQMPDEEDLAALIRLSWSNPLVHFREVCVQHCNRTASDPFAMLRLLGDVAQIEPCLVLQIDAAVQQYGYYERPQRQNRPKESELLHDRVVYFIERLDRLAYGTILRGQILTFCMQQAVSPLVVAHIAAETPYAELSDGQHLSTHLYTDVALRCVYTAWHSFWS